MFLVITRFHLLQTYPHEYAPSKGQMIVGKFFQVGCCRHRTKSLLVDALYFITNKGLSKKII